MALSSPAYYSQSIPLPSYIFFLSSVSLSFSLASASKFHNSPCLTLPYLGLLPYFTLLITNLFFYQSISLATHCISITTSKQQDHFSPHHTIGQVTFHFTVLSAASLFSSWTDLEGRMATKDSQGRGPAQSGVSPSCDCFLLVPSS